MTKNHEAITADITHGIGEIRKALPEVMKNFSALAGSATRDGALDHKTKELLALAIGVATHCDGCIGFHTRALARAGATREEVMETLAVTIYMGGGPSLMYAADAIHAFDRFAEDATGDG